MASLMHQDDKGDININEVIDEKDVQGEGRAMFLNEPGTYFFINPNTTPIETAEQQAKISALTQSLTALRTEGKLKHIWYDREQWSWAVQQVRAKSTDGSYACGTTIGPGFFDTDKMAYTVNYIILFVSAKPGKGKGIPNSTNGFVVLRDLSRMDDIRNLIIHPDPTQLTTLQTNFGKNVERHKYLSSIITIPMEPYIYIEGLCVNSQIPSVPRGTAINLMDLVHEIIFRTGQEFFLGCKLASLVYVMQFYFNKFSYRFRYGCGPDSTVQRIASSKGGQSPAELNRVLNTLTRMPHDDDAWDDKAWNTFLQHLIHSGFNAEVGPEQVEIVQRLRNQPLFDDDGDKSILDRYQELFNRLGVQDQGFNMYFCFYNNPTLDITVSHRISPYTLSIINVWRAQVRRAPARKAALKKPPSGYKAGGDRKRRRKRTKKRALKKKHRRTKRKRKRKTRRRKKRGGKHKLSNKKCKMLKHRHSKLTHHVNVVGKALQVQCKKRL